MTKPSTQPMKLQSSQIVKATGAITISPVKKDARRPANMLRRLWVSSAKGVVIWKVVPRYCTSFRRSQATSQSLSAQNLPILGLGLQFARNL
ncbi:MAG: hypothetical protein ACPG4J_09840, partial [Lentibacter algarum]